MEVFIQWDIETAYWKVYIVAGGEREERKILRVGAGGELEAWPERQVPSVPTFVLTDQMMSVFGKELKKRGYTPKDEDDTPAIKAHLADAVAVRDRLLAIVERPS